VCVRPGVNTSRKFAVRVGEKRTLQMGEWFHWRQSPLKVGFSLAANAR
jgi:hypothetical protein